MKLIATLFGLVLLSGSLFAQPYRLGGDTIYYDPSNPPQVFKGGVEYVEYFSLPTSLPKTNLLGYWDYSYGINADSTIYLVDATNTPVDTIKLSSVDFDISSGYIPLKTTSTFTMQSINDIDTAFWNHAVYPTTVFQNIDYDSTTYFKVEDHVLNADSTELHPARITEIAMYSQATDANTYFSVPALTGSEVWVNKFYTGGSNDGTYAKPYTSINAAYKAKTPPSAFVVKSGVYNEDFNGTTAIYLYLNAGGGTISAIGNCEIRSDNTSYVVRVGANATHTLKRFIINAENNAEAGLSLVPSYNSLTNLNNCVFTQSKTYDISSGANAQIQNVVLSKCVSTIKPTTVVDGITIYESYITSTTVSKTINKNYWNDIHNSLLYYGDNAMYKFNNVQNNKALLTTTGALGVLKFSYNTVNFSFIDGGLNISLIQTPLAASQLTPMITNNKFISLDTGTLARQCRFIDLQYCKTPRVDSNIFISKAKSVFYHIYALASDSVFGKCLIRNNYSQSNSQAGYIYTLGAETTKEGKFDESELMYNHLVGHLVDYPSLTGSLHAMFINAAINCKLAFNKIEHILLGMVIKTGTGQSYASGGIYGNVFVNNLRDIWIRKASGVLIANNTLYSTIENESYKSKIAIDDYLGYHSSNDSIINNILYVIDNANKIYFGNYAAQNGCYVSNTVLWDGYQFVLNDSISNYTLPQAIAAGYMDETVIQENPSFTSATQLWPAISFTGTNLGTDYADGLDISTTWGSSTTLPNVVTKQQGATWQIGAYVQ